MFLPNEMNLAQVTCGTLGLSTATVKLVDADGKEHIACSVGTGPVDSAYKAVDIIVQVWNRNINDNSFILFLFFEAGSLCLNWRLLMDYFFWPDILFGRKERWKEGEDRREREWGRGSIHCLVGRKERWREIVGGRGSPLGPPFLIPPITGGFYLSFSFVIKWQFYHLFILLKKIRNWIL